MYNNYYAINTYDDDYLAHHGILGQKWGVRRYQNEDGSLTKAGKKRYAKYDNYAKDKDMKIANLDIATSQNAILGGAALGLTITLPVIALGASLTPSLLAVIGGSTLAGMGLGASSTQIQKGKLYVQKKWAESKRDKLTK